MGAPLVSKERLPDPGADSQTLPHDAGVNGAVFGR